MHAILNRYEGVDASRTIELTKKVNETLIPRLSKLPGFDGYFLIEADNGVVTSISLFDTPAHADESARVASSWMRDKAGERASECADGHLRRGSREAVERGRPRVSRGSSCMEGPRSRAFQRRERHPDESDPNHRLPPEGRCLSGRNTQFGGATLRRDRLLGCRLSQTGCSTPRRTTEGDNLSARSAAGETGSPWPFSPALLVLRLV